MTPHVIRNGPESLVAQPPQRERNGGQNGDFAAMFGALRQAEPPRQPEAPRHEPPRAAAPAVPDRPIDEAPRAELPAAPEATDKQAPRSRTPRQPAPPGLPATATGTEAASKADADALMAVAGVAGEDLQSDSEVAPPAAADALLVATATPAPSQPSSPEAISPSTSDEQAAASGLDGLDGLKPAGAEMSAQPTENAAVAQTATKPTEPAAANPLVLSPTREAPPKPQQAAQEPSGLRGPDALPALPGSQPLAPSAPSASPAQATLGLPPQHPGFAEELAAQLSVWTRQGVQQAELRLNPAELGPVQVRIQIEGQQAMVRFVADAAPTRDALEAAMPELAAALQREGLQLSGGSVQSQSQHQQQQQQQREAAAALSPGRSTRTADASLGAATPPAARALSQRLLDLYA